MALGMFAYLTVDDDNTENLKVYYLDLGYAVGELRHNDLCESAHPMGKGFIHHTLAHLMEALEGSKIFAPSISTLMKLEGTEQDLAGLMRHLKAGEESLSHRQRDMHRLRGTKPVDRRAALAREMNRIIDTLTKLEKEGVLHQIAKAYTKTWRSHADKRPSSSLPSRVLAANAE